MELFKWKTNFKPKFPRFVEKLFGKKINEDKHHDDSVGLIPSVNVEDADKAFEVSVALPGMDKKDVQVEIDNGVLIIRSEKQYSDEEKNKNYIRREFGYASFQRMFELPDYADSEKVNAKMENGVLNIQVAKKKEALPVAKTVKVN